MRPKKDIHYVIRVLLFAVRYAYLLLIGYFMYIRAVVIQNILLSREQEPGFEDLPVFSWEYISNFLVQYEFQATLSANFILLLFWFGDGWDAGLRFIKTRKNMIHSSFIAYEYISIVASWKHPNAGVEETSQMRLLQLAVLVSTTGFDFFFGKDTFYSLGLHVLLSIAFVVIACQIVQIIAWCLSYDQVLTKWREAKEKERRSKEMDKIAREKLKQTGEDEACYVCMGDVDRIVLLSCCGKTLCGSCIDKVERCPFCRSTNYNGVVAN